jgi:hypothetical protein
VDGPFPLRDRDQCLYLPLLRVADYEEALKDEELGLVDGTR